MFHNNKNWIRYKTQKLIRSKYKGLYQPIIKEKLFTIKDFVFDKKRWWFILLIVTILFVGGCLIDIKSLNIIHISAETARIIVDQRAANIATIISITLVVVGFLINNLALKEPFAYRLLFKHSYLYPIIYFTLSTIGCFFLLSLLRDAFGPKYFIKLVLAGSYLALIILFLIGFLFRTIIQFTNEKVIIKLLHKELINESIFKLKEILLRNYSNNLFNEQIVKFGATLVEDIDPMRSLSALLNSDKLLIKNNPVKRSKEKLVFDINLLRIKRIIIHKRKSKIRVNCLNLSIGKRIHTTKDFIWQDEKSNNYIEKLILRNSIVLKNVYGYESDTDQVRKYFDLRLETLTKNNDYRNLEELLNSYYEIYELQIKYER